uniref:Uncharacterized protein n=1 Tax=Anguilla anguilla TaxID=7936 RepID=A0A0E9PDL9_ANGAN
MSLSSCLSVSFTASAIELQTLS